MSLFREKYELKFLARQRGRGRGFHTRPQRLWKFRYVGSVSRLYSSPTHQPCPIVTGRFLYRVYANIVGSYVMGHASWICTWALIDNDCQVADDVEPLAAYLSSQLLVPNIDIPQDAFNASALSSTDWAKGQADGALISRVKTLLLTQKKPTTREASYEHPEVRKFLKDWNKLNIKDGILYRHTTINGLEYSQLIASAAIKDTILKTLHDDQCHQGRDRTAWLVKTRFFWMRMDSDIERKVRQCDRYIRQKTRPVPAAELVNITSNAPMDIVCIDYLSLEMSKGGYENVLVITDHFTRYAQAFPNYCTNPVW